MKHVNIIMAAYNGSKFIREQIESILGSEHTEWTLWIFDDGSTDGTSSIIKEYEAAYPDNIKYRKNEVNLGVTKNFLNGLCYVVKEHKKIGNIRNSYFMFCDQDDFWYSDKITNTLKYMQRIEKKFGSNKPVAVFTDVNVVDENLRMMHPSFHGSNHLDTKKTDLTHLLMENKLNGCSMMINFSLADKVSITPDMEIRYHDWWIGLIAASFGHIGYLPEATMAYRQHSNNMVGDQNFRGYIKRRLFSLKEQREVLKTTVKQAKVFYSIYSKELKPKQKLQIYTFANLYRKSFIERRILVVKYGYLKSGLLRNVGLLLIL